MKKVKYIAVGVVIVGFLVGIWSCAGWLLSKGRPSSDVFGTKEEIKAPTEHIDDEVRGTIDDGKIEMEMGSKGVYTPVQGSNVVDNVVSVSYVYMKSVVPSVSLDGLDYEVKKVKDGYYCFKTGDWFLFLKEEYGFVYVVKLCKSVEFTEEEKGEMFKVDSKSSFDEKDGVFEWVREEGY